MNIISKILLRLIKYKNILRSNIIIVYYSTLYEKLKIKEGTYIDNNVRIKLSDNGTINLSRNVFIERYSSIVAKRGFVNIGENVFVGEGTIIVSNTGITIGDDCLIASGVTIRDQDHRIDDLSVPIRQQGNLSDPIVIGDDVWIGAKVSILKGVTIGDHAVVGANSVVTKSIPHKAVAVGAPAKVIRYRDN